MGPLVWQVRVEETEEEEGERRSPMVTSTHAGEASERDRWEQEDLSRVGLVMVVCVGLLPDRHLAVVEKLACSNEPKTDAVWSFSPRRVTHGA